MSDASKQNNPLEALRERSAVFGTSSLLDPAAVVADVRAVIRELEAHPPGPERDAVAALAHGRLATGLRLQGALRRAFEAATEAEALARRSGDPDARAVSLMVVGHVFTQVGQGYEALRWLRQAAALEGISPELELRARVNIATALRAGGQLAEAEAAFDALMPLRGAGPDTLRAGLLINAASCWHQVGRAGDARGALDEARASLVGSDRADLVNWADAIGAWVAAATGDAEGARAQALAVLAPDRSPSLPVRGSAARALAKAALAATAPALGAAGGALVAGAVAGAGAEPASRHALDLRRSLAEVAEREGDLVAAVRHLRAAERLDAQLVADAARLRLEREELRLEFARARAEADTLRAHGEVLAEANAALAAADAARARLLRTLAHDLRGPLTSVIAAAELIGLSDPSEAAGYTETILTAADRMLGLIDESLAPAELGARAVEVDLGALARESARTFLGLASRKDQTIVVTAPDPAAARVPPASAGRILDNLLSNALKFSPPGGVVAVQVTPSEGRVDVDVLDRGRGFPGMEPAEGLVYGGRLASRATAGEAGWGLGLHTVYRLVAELGGVVALGNRPGGGAAVRVSLPRR